MRAGFGDGYLNLGMRGNVISQNMSDDSLGLAGENSDAQRVCRKFLKGLDLFFSAICRVRFLSPRAR